VNQALLQQLVEQYGYWAVAIGTLLEGETLLILGGFAAHRGYLELPWVVAVAALGGWAGDQFWFWMGRSRGSALLERLPRLKQHAGRVEQLLARHQDCASRSSTPSGRQLGRRSSEWPGICLAVPSRAC
jgi:membrane protein DedA with SNARE-associated domain